MTIFWMLIAQGVYAGPFQDAQSFGRASNSKAIATTHGSVNANTVPGFTTANPPHTSFANNPAALSNAGTTAAVKDATGAGKFIVHSAATRAQFQFTASDPLMKGAKGIYKNAQALTGMNTAVSAGACRNVTTTSPDIYRTSSCSSGKTSNVFSNHICTTGRTPDIFSNHSCASGRTSDVFGSYACTRGRTPDVFSNHACAVRNDPNTYANHSCYTGRRSDIYKNYTCTKSRPTVFSTCARALVVTTTSRPYCYTGQSLGGSRMYGIAGPGTYGSPGYMDFTAQCGAPGGWTNVYVHGANWLGNCDGFKGNNNGHINVNIPPWPTTGYNYAGGVYLIKWSGYFSCMNPARVYYQSHGCQGNRCSATFKVADGSTHIGCANGSIPQRSRARRGLFCQRVTNRTRNPVRATSIPDLPKYITLAWTRAHNIMTYHDQWVNQACR